MKTGSRSALIYADGGSRGNPGPAGIGAVVEESGEIVCVISEYLGNTTNNVAEYTALLRILEKSLELGYENVEVRMDSELVVNQMIGRYRVKHPGLKPLYEKARLLAQRFHKFEIKHVRRQANKEADRLANEAMNLASLNVHNSP